LGTRPVEVARANRLSDNDSAGGDANAYPKTFALDWRVIDRTDHCQRGTDGSLRICLLSFRPPKID
jgi:hypothetical protein